MSIHLSSQLVTTQLLAYKDLPTRMSLNARIAAQRKKLAAAKRKLNSKDNSASHNAATQKFNGWTELETKQQYVTGSRAIYSPPTTTARPQSPPTNSFSAKVRAAGPLRTPDARRSDFRRMSSFSGTNNIFTDAAGTGQQPNNTETQSPPATYSSPNANHASPYARQFGNLSSTFENKASNNEDPTNKDIISNQLRQHRVATHLTLSDPNPKDLHTITALRDQLARKRDELKAAQEELSFTGDIMNMLRADIAKTDSESEMRITLIQEAKDMKLRSKAEVDVLHEQLSTRDRILVDLRHTLDQTSEERDLREKNVRELREAYDTDKMNNEVTIQRNDAKLNGIKEELTISKSQEKNSLKRITALERQLDTASKQKITIKKEHLVMNEKLIEKEKYISMVRLERDRLQHRLNESTVTNQGIETELNHTKGLLKMGNTDASKRAKKSEAHEMKLETENNELKQRLIEILAGQTFQNSRICELEQEILDLMEDEDNDSAAMTMARDSHVHLQQYGRGSNLSQSSPLGMSNTTSSSSYGSLQISKKKLKELKKLKGLNVHLEAELIANQKHLENREEQIENLKKQLLEAETSVMDRRKSMARRNSVGARQAATLSIQLARSESSLEVMEINYKNLKAEFKTMKYEKLELQSKFNEQRMLNNTNKEDYLYAKDDVATTSTMLVDAREEVKIQKNIVREQNARLNKVSEELENYKIKR